MKRREFMIGTALAGAGISTLGMAGCAAQQAAATAPGELAKILERYQRDLFDSFLPNMDQLVIDHEYGGFMCSVNIETRQRAASNKSAWFEGRGLWTYSFLYNKLKKDPRYLEVARKSKDFILKARPAGDTFWTASFSREGKPLTGPGDIYASLFVAEGLAEYAQASGESQYFTMAKEILISCMARYDREDYAYHVTYLSPQAPQVPAPRVLGHWMIFLRALTQMLEQQADAELEGLAARCVDAILNHHLNPAYQLFNELLKHDFTRPDNEFKDFAYMGHGIETCWMLMYEARRRKDRALFERAAGVFKRHVQVAKDQVYGGYFRSLDHVDNNQWKLDKVLWLQEEILIGSLFLAEHTGDAWVMDLFRETLAYVHEKFAQPGYAFWIPNGDRQLKVNQLVRAEHYHHPRHLMLNILTLERMMKHKGRPATLFS